MRIMHAIMVRTRLQARERARASRTGQAQVLGLFGRQRRTTTARKNCLRGASLARAMVIC